MLARCPTCRNTFQTDRTGRQDCPVCGKPLVVPGPPAPEAGPPPAGGEAPPGPAPAGSAQASPSGEPAGTPWERRAEGDAFDAWKQTLLQALFEPGKLFRSARLDRSSAQLGFALVTASPFWALGQLIDRFFLSGQRQRMMDMVHSMAGGRALPPLVVKLIESTNNNSAGVAIVAAMFTPLIVLILLYANAAVTHGAALLLGQSKRGFAATFAAAAYGFAPLVLLAVPGCGGLIAMVWCAVLTGIGLKDTHRITPGGAAGVVLAPYLLFCCAGCALAAVVGMMVARASGALPAP